MPDRIENGELRIENLGVEQARFLNSQFSILNSTPKESSNA